MLRTIILITAALPHTTWAKAETIDVKDYGIRNVKSKHWTRWLGAESRCVVSFHSFSEFNKAEGGDIWFTLDETQSPRLLRRHMDQLNVRAEGQGRRDHQCPLRVPHDGAEGRGWRHPPQKAMPVILTTPEEGETRMTAPPDEALKLQRPLPDGKVRIVARGVKEAPAGLTTGPSTAMTNRTGSFPGPPT